MSFAGSRRPAAWIWIVPGACLLLGVGAWRILRGTPAGTAAPVAAAPDEGAPVDVRIAAAPAAAPAAPATTPPPEREESGRSIRLRRPDGSYLVVAETAAMVADREAKWDHAQESLREATVWFRNRFKQVLRDRGPAGAHEFLAGYFREPGSFEDEAHVYEALRIAAEIQRDLGEKPPGTSAYEGMRSVAGQALADLLGKAEASPYLKRIALANLAGLQVRLSVPGWTETEVDGLPAYDPAEPFRVVPEIQNPTEHDLKRLLAAPRRALSDPALAEACRKAAQDSSAVAYLRASAIWALYAGTEGPSGADLAAWSADPEPEIRQAAVNLLSVRPGGIPSETLFGLLSVEKTPELRQLLVERAPADAFSHPRMTEVLGSALPDRPFPAYEKTEETVSRETVLRIVLARYGDQRRGPLLSLLAGRLPQWSSGDWSFSGSPVVLVAEAAAGAGWTEFAPHLKSVVETLPSDADRQKVRAALTKLGN
jgi:hypothetical protein